MKMHTSLLLGRTVVAWLGLSFTPTCSEKQVQRNGHRCFSREVDPEYLCDKMTFNCICISVLNILNASVGTCQDPTCVV